MSKNVSRARSSSRSGGSASPRRLRPRASSSASDSITLLSPGSRRSLLNDNTEIDVPRRKSWWKKIGKNSIDIKEVFGDYVAEDENFDIENIVQHKPGPSNRQMKKTAIDLGNMSDSSTSESLGSIHIPQRKLFVNRQTQQPNEFLNIVVRRESLRSNINETEKTIQVPKKDLFRKSKAKEKKDNAFPVSIGSVNTANNTTKKDDGTINIEADGLKKPLFGKRQANNPAPFPVFVMSESEDDTPQIHPRLTAFKKNPQMMTRSRRASAGSRSSKRAHSPASSVYSETMEIETWKLLPSSTMIGDDLVMNTPAKRLRRDKTITEVNDEMENNEAPEIGKMMVDQVEYNNFAENIQIEPDHIVEENKDQTKNNREEIESVRPQNEEEESDKANDHDFINENVQIAQESDNDSRDNERNDDSIEQPKNEDNAENAPELNDDDNDEDPEGAIQADCGDQADNEEKSQKEIAEDSQGEDNHNDEDSELNQGEVENVTEEQNENTMADEVESILKSDYEESDKDDSYNKEKNDVSESVGENTGGLEDIQEVENEEESDNENSIVKNKSQEVENSGAFHDDDIENNQNQDEVENVAEADDEQDDDNSEEMTKMEISAESDNEENIRDSEKNYTAEDKNDADVNPSENEDNEDEHHYENEAKDPTMNKENEVEHPIVNEGNEVEHPSENEEHEVEDTSEKENEIEDPSENEEHEVKDTSEKEENEVEGPSKNVEHDVEEPSENEEREEEDPSENEEHEVEENSEKEENEIEDSSKNEEHEVEDTSEKEENEVEDTSENEDHEVEGTSVEEENEATLIEDNEADDPSDNEENEAVYPTVNEENESEVEDPSDNEENSEEEINQNGDTSDDNNADHLNVKSVSGKSTDDERTPNKSKNKSRRISPRSTNVSKGGIDPPRMSQGDNSNRHSAEFSKNMTDEVRYSSEGSGWNSHTTAYIQRAEQTMNARKSLRTLVLDKAAKMRPSTKATEKLNDDHNFTKPASPARFSVTNNTIENNISVNTPDTNKTSSSNRTQTSMDRYIKKITQDNWERQQKIQEKVQNGLKANSLNFEAKYFQWSEPNQRKVHRKDQNNPKAKAKQKETLKVVIDGAVYKPPKLFKPPKAPWVNKNLYKFLDVKLKPKYRYNTRIQSERFVRLLFEIYKHCVKRSTDVRVSVKSLKKKMALLDLVTTHFDFYNFVEEYMPKDFRIRVIPDHINCLPMPRNGLFGNIIDPNDG